MATRAVQQVVTYGAWDTAAAAWKTGDSANHTLRWVKDGTASAPTNAAAEVDATNCPGQYKVTITSTEADCLQGVLCGKSSTADIVIVPTMVGFVDAPLSASGVRDAVGLASANLDTQIGTVDTVVDAIKAKTDSLTFTETGKIDANTVMINGAAVAGTGTEGDLWRGVAP